MEAITPGLAGQKGLRGEILLQMKKSQPLTAKELAEAFGVSANAVRRHLKELEAEHLVHYGREQRGVGAPTYSYRLSRDGEALFPNQYEQALTRLIGHVVDREGREAAIAVVEEQYADLRRQLGGIVPGVSPIDRLKMLAGVMEEAGFMAESSEENGEVTLRVQNCALHAVASCLPEVCDTELKFLEDALHAQVERKTHIMNGCNACEYAVEFAGPTWSGAKPERLLHERS
ncbi:MAG: HTH domain-containing protein [Gemmatimonadetes bacterium]|nr:HTH domain-containing protein [Gemmatimonadota bacterium]